MSRWLIALIIVLLGAIASAQEATCPAMQDLALANIAAHCAEQEPGTLCLGNDTVTAVHRPPAPATASMKQPGDTVSIDSIDWLSISTEDQTWGAARAVFPAYADDSFDLQTSALLAFGNVALFFPAPLDLPSPLVDLEVASARGAYLRALPNIDARILSPLAVRTKLKAIGASPNRNWRLVYATPDLRGWMSAEVVTAAAGDLPVMDSDADTVLLWLPWQTFDFHSGIADASCAESLESGILLQAPNFIAPRHFAINGIRVLLSGAAWLQAQVNSGTRISVIDGTASVSAMDVTQVVKRGFQTSVALELTDDHKLIPAAAPLSPVAYDYQHLLSLPIHALLYPSRVSINVYAVATPVPADGGSPLTYISSDDSCRISAGLDGANIRSRPDPEAPIIAVMAYRESAEPVSRGIGVDRLPWWKLANSVWIRVDATVFGGNCNDVPLILPGN